MNRGLRGWMAFCACVCIGAGAATSGAEAQDCMPDHGQLMRLRDAIERATRYLEASKDNFGPGRMAAIAAMKTAAEDYATLPSAQTITAMLDAHEFDYPGRHGHPRMQRALAAVVDGLTAIAELRGKDAAPCNRQQGLLSVTEDLELARSEMYRALSFNRPYSGN